MIKFIHCADIHLGKIQNNLDQRFEDFGNAFKHVIDEALARKVDFLLIAGDLFDKRSINARTLKQVVEILEPLKDAGIPVITTEGNHDKAFLRDKESWMTFLAHRGYIILLKPVFEGGKMIIEAFDKEDCSGCYIDLNENLRFYGIGYLGRSAKGKLEEMAEHFDEDKTNILLLHAMVGRMGGAVIGSISKKDVAFLKEKITYLALGHGHNRYVVEKSEDVIKSEDDSDQNEMFQRNRLGAEEEVSAAHEVIDEEVFSEVISNEEDFRDYWGHNPGSVEHCRLDEANHQHGFFYVELEDKEVTKVEHIQSKRRCAKIIVVDITGCLNPEAVYEKMFQEVEGKVTDIENPLLRIVLHGEISFDILEIDEEVIRKQIDEICAPLILEIDIKANLPQLSNSYSEVLERQAIEREVLRKKVERSSKWGEFGDDLVNLILEIKEDVTTGVPSEEILAKVMTMVEGEYEDS